MPCSTPEHWNLLQHEKNNIHLIMPYSPAPLPTTGTLPWSGLRAQDIRPGLGACLWRSSSLSWWVLQWLQKETGETFSDGQFGCLLLPNESHPKYSKASYLLQTSSLSHETSCLLFWLWHHIWFCMIEIKSVLTLLRWVLFIKSAHFFMRNKFQGVYDN